MCLAIHRLMSLPTRRSYLDEMSDWECLETWQRYCFATRPDDYAHHEDHTLIRYGDNVCHNMTSDEDDGEWRSGCPLHGSFFERGVDLN